MNLPSEYQRVKSVKKKERLARTPTTFGFNQQVKSRAPPSSYGLSNLKKLADGGKIRPQKVSFGPVRAQVSSNETAKVGNFLNSNVKATPTKAEFFKPIQPKTKKATSVLGGVSKAKPKAGQKYSFK